MAAQTLMDEPEWSASEQNRENAYYERYCFIQVTCNMNAKGQTWNENIRKVTRPKERSRVNSLVKLNRGVAQYTKQACVLRYKS